MIKSKNLAEMPTVKDYLTAVQRDGGKLCAEDVYKQVITCLREKGCSSPVLEQVVEQYAMSVARWVHLEQKVSEFGYIAKHPTTGAPMQSPYVMMSQAYLKQVLALRTEIEQLEKDAHPASPTMIREVVYGG